MHTTSGTSIYQALYRVFIQPSLAAPLTRQTPVPRLQCRKAVITHPQRRLLNYRKSPGPVQRSHLYDEEIKASRVHIVTADGVRQPAQSLVPVLRSYNRTTHRLVQVAPANPHDPDSFPTCKIISKQQLREQERAKAKPKKNPQDTGKQLELSWAIEANDLGHRMRKMKGFLEEGRRVEIVIAKKKDGRKASPKECDEVIAKVRQAVTEVEGAKESKGMEGKVGGTATLFFEGRAREKEKRGKVGKGKGGDDTQEP